MTYTKRVANEKRQLVRDNAAGMGIDDKYISCLVDTFYERIQNDETLGPIFNTRIGENWVDHLSTMKDFWASIAFNAGRYSGRPLPTHMRMKEVNKTHFDVWLKLFEETLVDTAPTSEAVDYLLVRAKRIAQSFQLAMFFTINGKQV